LPQSKALRAKHKSLKPDRPQRACVGRLRLELFFKDDEARFHLPILILGWRPSPKKD